MNKRKLVEYIEYWIDHPNVAEINTIKFYVSKTVDDEAIALIEEWQRQKKIKPNISEQKSLTEIRLADEDEIKDNLWGAIDGVQAAIKALEALPIPIGSVTSCHSLLKKIDADLRNELLKGL